MEETIRARLLATAALTGVAVNWVSHPQGAALPALVLNVVSGAAGLTMQGTDKLVDGRIQVDCYAASYSAALTVSRAVVTSLHGYRSGSLRLVRHVATRDGREGGTNEADRPYRVSLDFETSWKE